MIPTLYSEAETSFTSNGIGRLTEAISCFVTEERNGEYELEMEYPVSGKYYSEIKKSRIIFAAPADGKSGQPFRIYRITKPFDGIITINAEHISYQLSLIPVTPFEAGSSQAARIGIWNNAVGTNPFTHWSDIQSTASYKVTVPQSLRACLGGVRGSFLDVYGGEFEWDKWEVKIHAQRGTNRNVTIRYGKNLTDFEQEENIQEVITGILPYWYNSEEENLVMLDERVIMSSYANNYPFRRVIPIDFTGSFENTPTQSQLRSEAQSYITTNKIGIPKVNITVSFIPLFLTEEYKNKVSIERVNLCDTVSVYFEKLGISATAKVIKTVYNTLLDRYDSIELGDAKSSLEDTLIRQQSDTVESLDEKIAKKAEFLQKAIDDATKLISGGLGGYVVIEPNPTTGLPEEILIMDQPDKGSANNVIRINKNGIGFSQNGYDPPSFDTAWTIDGKFNASYIATGQLDTALLKTGVIADHNGNTTYDLDTGLLKSKNLVIDTKTEGGSFEIKAENFTVTPEGDVTLVDAFLDNAILRNALAKVKFEVRAENNNVGTYHLSTRISNLGIDICHDYNNNINQLAITGGQSGVNLYNQDNPDVVAYLQGNGITFDGSNGHILFINNGKNPNGIQQGIILYEDICIVSEKGNIEINSTYTPNSNTPQLQVHSDFVVYGKMWCDGGGQKLRAINTEHFGKVGLSAMESPEPVFSDFGDGIIGIDGRCLIEFDKVFCETVDLSKDYRVFYTQTSPGNINYVEKQSDCIIVHGESGTSFDWIVYARQIDYSSTRFLRMEQ